ncbi:MAG: 6-phosphogluconolactonase [Rhodobacter sp.]|uniref:6-phosphogluconolactonase n=1 Tax=Pararhodobacter sp. TaxID=2127056 RepID=UPI001DC8C0CB|nr:6-phosphogluconolactonase [Pararhodobacter sp.]MCB1346044.1 6-phosphogluconolactonase [Paracoccaceae bacterium]MCC0074020.1 6-phosphogluconolactonase [Rhodobacter sp.]HPD92325.1 6-phosphogluconolactonase [Pararhodobacter sp.]
MERIDYPDTDMMALSLARRLAGELRAALTRRPRALFAVPGGTSPGPVFDLLAAADLDWDRVDIVPTDERWLPESHARSNAGMIRARLLRDKAVPARLLPLWHEALSPAEGAEQAAAMLDRLLPVDVALLGMGADMHTASLFPGATGLDEALAADAPAVVPILAPGAPEPRVSLSARVLKDAYGLHLLIIGAEKRAALERARALAPTEAPVAAVLARAVVHWAP